MSQNTTPTSGAADLIAAAQAVVDRWDTPLWKDAPATAEYIGRLRAALASAPAQPVAEPAPSATAHVGDSLFESWFSEYNPALRGTKQLMRDAYAAGMGDPKAQPSPTPQADSVLEDAARSERERICAAIKVEDDYCVEQGD